MILYDINILVMISNDKAIINIFSKGIVLPKNENSVIIYSPCACSKNWRCLTKKKIFWRMVSNQL